MTSEQKTKKRGCLQWGLIILAGLILLALIGILSKGCGSDTRVTATKVTSAVNSDTIPIKTKLNNLIAGVTGKDGENLLDSVKSDEGFWIAFSFLQTDTTAIIKKTISDGESSNDKEIQQLTKKYLDASKAFRIKEYPKYRKKFAKILYEKFWEDDIIVGMDGSNSDILYLTGASFVTNKNIKEMQESLQDMLQRLRFKEVRYRWYKGQDDFTYFKIDAPKDGDL